MKAFIVLSMVIALVASFTVPDQTADRRIRRSVWGGEGEIKEVVVHKTVHVPYPVHVEKKVPVVVEKKVPVYIKEVIKPGPISIKIKKKKYHKH